MPWPDPSPYPDLAGAIRAHLRSLAAVTALVGDRVWIGWPRDPDGNLRIQVPPYRYAILVESGRGGIGTDLDGASVTERVDLSFLGPNEHDAHALYRTTAPYLFDPGHHRPQGFRAANTNVEAVIPEGGPIRQPDPATRWPRTWASYQFRYTAIPLSELVT